MLRQTTRVCRSRLPAAGHTSPAVIRTEIATPGIEPGAFLASLPRRQTTRPNRPCRVWVDSWWHVLRDDEKA